jgi:hypothetical protein
MRLSSPAITRTFYLFLFSILISGGAAAQERTNTAKHTISGYVKEKSSMELLLGVTVYEPGLKMGTASNTYGFYSLTLPADSVEIIFSYVGYAASRHKFLLLRDTMLNIELTPNNVLTEVVVTGEKENRVSESVQMSKIDIPIQQIKDIPAFMGEKDVMKVLQLMPGVQKGSEGSSGLYVRGGGPDQNLIILDDAVVYNANHLFGFFSLFNGDALKSVELTKGGFPARYGGRLSSVIDMNMKDGNKEKIHGEVGIGAISSRATVEGPLKKGKSSFLVSGRRTYVDLLIAPFLPKEINAGYYFYDLNAKVNYDFGDKDKVYLSGYFGKDKFHLSESYTGGQTKFGFDWGNATATARWNHMFNNKVFANTSLIFSNYDMVISATIREDGDTFSMRYNSGIRDFSLKHDLDFIPNPNHYIKAGVLVTQHHFTPSAFVVKVENFNLAEKETLDAVETGIYVEDQIRIGKRTKANPGIRVSHFNTEGKNYINPEPRIAIAHQLRATFALKASFATMNQYIHLLSNTGVGLPTDLWVPSTSKVAPQRSHQVAAGFAKDFLKENLALTIEGYYKKMERIVGYKEGASFLTIDDPTDPEAKKISWEDNVTQGQGWSYGAEFLLQRKKGKLTGWVGYTLSWTRLQFDELNFGKKYYAKYDRRHDISIVGIYKLKENVKLSATWVYGTGNAITLPLSTYAANFHTPGQSGSGGFWSPMVNEYGEKNNFRMAAYHRMDIGLQFFKKLGWGGERIFEASLYNAYSRQNPFFYYVSQDTVNTNVLKQVSIFPIIPSLSWTVKF